MGLAYLGVSIIKGEGRRNIKDERKRWAVSSRAIPLESVAGPEAEIACYFIRSRSFQCLIRYFVSE